LGIGWCGDKKLSCLRTEDKVMLCDQIDTHRKQSAFATRIKPAVGAAIAGKNHKRDLTQS
jgi:hypothetical protein